MESQNHIMLVDLIVNYVKNNIPSEEYIFIEVDSFGKANAMRVVDNYVPDVTYKTREKLIIGEAKTYEDFERKHSKDQFEAYLKECHLFDGDSQLVIAVPWQLLKTAQNYFRRIKSKTGIRVEVVILDDMGSERII